MKTIYIAGLRHLSEAGIREAFNKEKKFAIGVKNGRYDIDLLVAERPQIQIVKRFPETANVNYISDPEEAAAHILQPAVLQWVDK